MFFKLLTDVWLALAIRDNVSPLLTRYVLFAETLCAMPIDNATVPAARSDVFNEVIIIDLSFSHDLCVCLLCYLEQ